MRDFDYKDFGKDFVRRPVKKLKRLFQIIPHARDLMKIIQQIAMQVPAEARNVKVTIEYMEAQTRMMKPYQRQVQKTEPKIPQQPTDPTHTLLTWREFSDKVADRINELKFAEGIYIEGELTILLAQMDEDLFDLFDAFLFLIMQKGILFATEHMNRLSPKYHFEAGWSPADDVLLANLLAGCREYLTDWTDNIRKDAAQEIRKGTELSESIEEIGTRVSAVIESKKWRGTLIARTELMHAWNEAAFDRYYKAGFGKEGQRPPAHPNGRCGIVPMLINGEWKIVWMTARDPIVCEICEPLDGVPIDEIDENFQRISLSIPT